MPSGYLVPMGEQPLLERRFATCSLLVARKSRACEDAGYVGGLATCPLGTIMPMGEQLWLERAMRDCV